MATAVIGTGTIGSAIARLLAAGGENVRLASAGAVILALRFTVLKSVIDQLAGSLTGSLVVVPSNPLTIDADGNLARVLPGVCS